jgi:Domain of unknown function (DUF4437)
LSLLSVGKIIALTSSFAAISGSSNSMIAVDFQSANFVPVVATLPDGPAIAVLKGNPYTGPSDMLLRMPRGTGRMHIHSADYRLVVVEGKMKHWIAAETESAAKPLGPGSFWFQPANQAHADSCLSETCLMYINWSGKRDAMLAGE